MHHLVLHLSAYRLYIMASSRPCSRCSTNIDFCRMRLHRFQGSSHAFLPLKICLKQRRAFKFPSPSNKRRSSNPSMAVTLRFPSTLTLRPTICGSQAQHAATASGYQTALEPLLARAARHNYCRMPAWSASALIIPVIRQSLRTGSALIRA